MNLFEAIPDAMVITQYIDGRILMANPACIKVYGYTPQEMLGRTTIDLGIFKDLAQRNEAMRRIVDENEDFFMEMTYYDKQKNPRFGLFSGKNVITHGVQGLLIITRDITDRKQIESNLEDAKNRFNLLAKITSIVPWETNALLELQYVGPAVKHWGLDPAQSLNQPLVSIAQFSTPKKLTEALRSIIDGNAESYMACHSVTINHMELDIEIRAAPIRDAFGVVTGLTGTIQDVTRFINTERELRELAATDQVTKLYNRRGFLTKLNEHIKHIDSRRSADKRLLVLYIDLDDFKCINDQFGHDVGDELLLNVASSLTGTLRNTNIISRIGGDEFVALLTNTPAEFAEIVCQRVLAAFSNIVIKRANLRGVNASLGMVTVTNETAENALKRADAAMYKAKQNGKNQYRIE